MTLLMLVGTLATLLVSPGALADPTTESPASASADRPRIGLVLGGGGARGGSHVGVLRVLEELRVPIDYIAGSSIGAIVAGLYASGMSPDEMSETVQRIDWDDVLIDALPRPERPFRRKQEDLHDLFAGEVGLGRYGLRIPSGLVAGQKLGILLRSLTLHAAGIDDFDALGIPYRAVATNLEDGTMVVLDRGNLAEAMRASMAIPGFFTPVRWGDRVLVDGGVVRLLPVDVVQDMGADIVIAVDVNEALPPVDPNQSMFDVAVRALSVLMAANVVEAKGWLDEDDLFLRPDPEGIETLDFNQLGEAERRGRVAAEAIADELRSLSVSEEEFERYLERVRRPKAEYSGRVVVDRIAVAGNRRVPDELILRRLHVRTGQPLDLEVLDQDLIDVYRMGEFSRVSYDIRYEPTDDGATETVLLILTVEQERGPGIVRAGARIEGDLGGDAGFIINLMYRRSFIHRYRAEWRTFLSFGDLLEMNTEFFQYLGAKERWFVAPSARYIADHGTGYLNATEKIVVDGWAGWLGLELGIEVGTDLQARAGAFGGKLRSEVGGVAEVDPIDIDLGAWSFSVVYDRLDLPSFPSSGGYSALTLDLSRPSLGATDRYDRLNWVGTKPLSWGRNTLLGYAEFGTDLGSELPFYDSFRLGGPHRLSGFKLNQLRGDKKLLLKLRFYRRLIDLTEPIGTGIYGGVGGGVGSVLPSDEALTTDSLIPSGSVFVGAETMVGPLHLGWGWAEGGHRTFFLALGHLHRFHRY